MQRHFVKSIIGAAAVVLWTIVGGAMAADEPANIVKYRQATMKANGAHITMIAAVVKGEVSWSNELEGHAHALHEQSKNLLRLFPEGTGKGDTEVESAALPAIWEKRDEFEQAVKRLQDESGKMVEVAKSGDLAAIGQQLGSLGKQGCGGCHDTFREKK